MSDPSKLHSPWRERAATAGIAKRARIVCDYMAGMTDTYAIDEHLRLAKP